MRIRKSVVLIGVLLIGFISVGFGSIQKPPRWETTTIDVAAKIIKGYYGSLAVEYESDPKVVIVDDIVWEEFYQAKMILVDSTIVEHANYVLINIDSLLTKIQREDPLTDYDIWIAKNTMSLFEPDKEWVKYIEKMLNNWINP